MADQRVTRVVLRWIGRNAGWDIARRRLAHIGVSRRIVYARIPHQDLLLPRRVIVIAAVQPKLDGALAPVQCVAIVLPGDNDGRLRGSLCKYQKKSVKYIDSNTKSH